MAPHTVRSLCSDSRLTYVSITLHAAVNMSLPASDNQREWSCHTIGSFIYPNRLRIKSSVLRYTTFFRLGMKRKKVFYFAVMDTAQHVAVFATMKHDKNHPFILIHYKIFICKCFKVSFTAYHRN